MVVVSDGLREEGGGASPRPPKKGRKPTPPTPPEGGERELAGNDEQYIINKIDLANTLVLKVYLHFTPLPLRGGVGGEASFSPPFGGVGGGLLGEAFWVRLSGCVLKRGGQHRQAS